MANRYLLLLLLLLAGRAAFANMASLYVSGTRSATAFTSRDIDILSETLHIRIDSSYGSAKYTVEYTVKSDVAGLQIPLLFLAEGFSDSFRVWVDGRPVELQSIPEKYTQFAGSPYAAFGNSKESETQYLSEDQVRIAWEKTYGSLYRLRDLKYFETDLQKGVHKIRVEYRAKPWVDMTKWVQSSKFRYSLSPAKHWRSFGQLQITVEQEGVPKPMLAELGPTAEKWTGPSKIWTFNKLPAAYLSVSHTPVVSATATFFLELEPFGIGLLLAPLFFFLHLWTIRVYRKGHLEKKYSPVVIVGSLLLPFLWLFIFVTSYYFIDWLIGPVAGGQHGYVFMMVFLYPFIMPFYWAAMAIADRFWKRRYLQNRTL